MKASSAKDSQALTSSNPAKSDRFLSVLAWVIAISLVGFACYLGWRWISGQPLSLAFITERGESNASESSPVVENSTGVEAENAIPIGQVGADGKAEGSGAGSIFRRTSVHTLVPIRSEEKVRQYTVEKGDSVFEIAASFKIKPETVLWANYDQLKDNPDLISLGMVLQIPPVDGVLYQWKEGDRVEAVAGIYEAKPADMLNWPGNQFDLLTQQVKSGAWIVVPGGHREFRQWIIPTIPRGQAGVSREVYGGGACEGSLNGAYGSGAFTWPAGTHTLSGNDYWSGHLGIDIAAGEGAPIYAADSGVVVFAGWATGGYGNTIIIDHGNGYQTLYGHLSSVAAGCGSSVSKGSVIGYAGSTGNSTGAHLHFEVRYLGGFVSPWYVLPAP